jgi:pyrroline-5-carboxylate reductase
MKNKHIAFIGCGNMGNSLIGGLLADGYDNALITGAETDPARREAVVKRFGIEVFKDLQSAVTRADIIVLAVKPQIMAGICGQLREHLQGSGSLVISIAAGIELDSLGHWLGPACPVIRVMPNTPALVQSGASVLVSNSNVTAEHRNQAEAIMRAVGITLWLEDESQINTATAVSGSGPAYFFLVMEVIQKAAMSMGLDASQARILTLQTALGAARMALESESDTAQLRKQVTSPGGTTEQALNVLTGAGIERIFADALKAASDRSIELARLYGAQESK